MIKTRRLWMMAVMSMFSFALLVTRLGYLQLYCHAELTEKAERERSHMGPAPEPRGAILDRSGGVLAMSIEGGGCYADPKRILNASATAKVLAPLLDMPYSTLRSKLTESRRFVWLARRLDPEKAQHLRDLNMVGVSVAPEMKRFYPEERLAAHVLGVVSDTGDGLSGVEWIANEWLTHHGQPFLFKQWEFSKKPATPLATHAELPPYSVVLTIDRTLQTIVEQELAVQMSLSHPKSGTVIVEDPQTGEILAMATAPSYDPNEWGLPGDHEEFGPETLKNPAVEKVVEPGSTFKIVTASAALEEHKATPTDTFFCEYGNWQIPGRMIHDHEKEGWLSFADVIGHSSNIGTAKIGMRLGQNTLYRYARAFGFGMPTGCGLPGDGTGILRQPSEWRASSLATISFGQEVGVTLLQMTNAYAVVANGGLLLEPRLYKGVTDEQGHYQEWAARPAIRRVISPETVAQMREILQGVVERGTGKAAQVAGMDVAGKTGTAQKIDPVTHQYSDQHYLASFCGFAPVAHPRLVIGVFLDEPKGSYWGGSEAAPLFSRIVRGASTYLRMDNPVIGPLAESRTVAQS